MILSEKAHFSYVPYEPRQEFLEHSRNRGDLIKCRRKLDGGVILSRCSKGTQNFMFGSIADGDDECKPESFAVSCVQAVEPREVLAAHPVNAHTSCSAVESCVRARSRASLPASSGCALSTRCFLPVLKAPARAAADRPATGATAGRYPR